LVGLVGQIVDAAA
jgi:Na+/melibiose symporter-like transporter